MKRTFLAAAMILACTASANGANAATSDNLHFAYRPCLSPDGSTIYFSWGGDIMTVPATGGRAVTAVNAGGYENCPLVSPDGKYLAFSSDIMGNSDVYVMPLAGGKVRQLTWNEATDTPVSWSADSKYIYFESTRAASRKTSFRVSVDGGTPELMFEGYFNTVVNLVENPKTGEFLFNESMESISFPTRKGYKGDHNPNIKSYNPATRKYTELTDFIGKDQWPMTDKSGNIYYISDQTADGEVSREGNIYKYVKGGKPQRLTDLGTSAQYPSIAYSGSSIVFLKDYEINILDLSTGKVSTPKISISDNGVDVKRQFSEQKPSAAAVSPDGKKFAFAIRGLLYISDAKAKYLQKLQTPADERVSEVIWGDDNKTVYYVRTDKGWSNIYKIAADGSGSEVAVFTSRNNSKGLVISQKMDKFAFVDGSHSLMLHDMKNGSTEKIADAEFWSYMRHAVAFSHDDSYVAFEAMNMFESDIFVCSLKDKKVTNLTNSASTDGDMEFSPDGKYLYMLSNPTATSFPQGSRTSLFKLALRKYDGPFKSDNYDNLFEDKNKKAAGDSSVVIDFKDIYRRMTQVESSGSQSGLYMFSKGDKSLLLYRSFGGTSNGLMALDINDPEAKPKAVKDVTGGSFFRSKNDLFVLSQGAVYKIDPNSLSATKTAVSVNLEKQLQDEFSQMFYEAWGALEQNYYDVRFHGADWYAVKDRYASYLPYVETRENIRTLIQDMLGELNSSHLGFTSNGSEERTETKVRTLQTGIVFDNKNPYKVEKILAWSPADKLEIDIRKGDELMAVNGTRVDKTRNREMYFTTPLAADEVRLTFKRSGKEFDVKVHTTTLSSIKSLMYREWEDERKARVEEKGKGRIAYHHMQAMGSTDLQAFLLAMHTDAVHKDALILDLRYNNGGNVHNEVIEFLTQQRYFDWSYRDFPKTSHPNVTPADKPIVVLVNEHSLSDAEVTSNGIKTLGFAKIIGTETYRWIIFTSSVGLIDGSTCRMPAWGCYNLKGEDLESIGVTPDIYIKNTFKDRLDGNDPQLDAAIAEVLKELK